jgi:hypothetical protein
LQVKAKFKTRGKPRKTRRRKECRRSEIEFELNPLPGRLAQLIPTVCPADAGNTGVYQGDAVPFPGHRNHRSSCRSASYCMAADGHHDSSLHAKYHVDEFDKTQGWTYSTTTRAYAPLRDFRRSTIGLPLREAPCGSDLARRPIVDTASNTCSFTRSHTSARGSL